MATDYIIFVHGVKTRERDLFERTASEMFARMKPYLQSDSSRTFKPITLFWGDIAEDSTNLILNALKDSPTWSQFWFQKFRTEQVIPFVGDAALYLSRHVSVQIIKQMTAQAIEQMGLDLEEIQQKSKPDGDRLHLVTHSWGTVILFDIMFATRWEDVSLDPEIIEFVNTLRSCFFGVGNPEINDLGMPIASIHTMGSPISLFNLLNASGAKSFNLTPELKNFLSSLYQITGKPLPWFNYTHPGDPLAYPLKGVMDLSLGDANKFVTLEDIIAPTNSWLQFFNQNIISIIQGGEAHNSYWTNELVSQKIGQVIQSC
ncbi:hypothetical protein [Chamaesiphon minutus]|uniref:AB hydrolase-1 domain-containing protein n=1 Tax=Chamaesiphon minutus (strain ATCC 27169 / PCC 6605) TaxID=1173020 RepID=K9UGS9_CHAP6|nr:hypothetical protein [Chamaesiphon minutus]AFY93409.1 hypothetical protein Cha6605_2334 [Chamaesiphon minutus PCC 6605]